MQNPTTVFLYEKGSKSKNLKINNYPTNPCKDKMTVWMDQAMILLLDGRKTENP